MCAPFVYSTYDEMCILAVIHFFGGGKWKCGKERKKEKGEGEEANWSETCKSLAEERGGRGRAEEKVVYALGFPPLFSLRELCVFPQKKKYSKV